MPVRLGLVVLVILGCAGVGPGADGEGKDPEDEEEAAPVPTSGEYVFEVVDSTSDCPDRDEDEDEDEDEEREPVEIIIADDGGSVRFEDTECDLDGVAFECTLADDEIDYDETAGMDAIVTIRATIEGRWTSDTRIEATSHTEVSCEGSACDDLEDMGTEFCSSESDLVGTLED